MVMNCGAPELMEERDALVCTASSCFVVTGGGGGGIALEWSVVNGDRKTGGPLFIS